MKYIYSILVIVLGLSACALNTYDVTRYDKSGKKIKYKLTASYCGFVFIEKENIGAYVRDNPGISFSMYVYNMNKEPVDIKLPVGDGSEEIALSIEPISRVNAYTFKSSSGEYAVRRSTILEIIINSIKYEEDILIGPNKHDSYLAAVADDCKAPKNTEAFMKIVKNPPEKDKPLFEKL